MNGVALPGRTAAPRQGFTLVELMVTTVIMGIVLVYVFATMVTSQREAQVLDQVVEIQENSRVIIEILENDLRHAGMMVPASGAICGIDRSNGPDTLFVSDHEVVEPAGELVPDLGAVVQGGVTNVSTGSQVFAVDSLILERVTPAPAYDSDADGTPDSDFRVQSGVIITDTANPDRGVACGQIANVVPGSRNISFDLESPVLAPVPAGGGTPVLVMIPARRFAVDANGQLFRDRYLIASNVEDLQLAFFVDVNDDNVVDADEYRGDGVGPNYVSNASNVAQLKEIRVGVVLRTREREVGNAKGRPQPLENRAAWGAADGFRRRIQTSTVRLRNVAGRLNS